jgi:hypothetical protein
MLHFRLRTLLIAMTVACMYLAWVGYCRRMASFYREQSSELLLQVVKQEGNEGRTLDWEQRLMSDLIEGLPEQAAKMNNPKWVDEDAQNPVFASAVVHEITARKYDRAAWNPLVLISD